MKQTALGGTLRSCAFVAAQAEAVLGLHWLLAQRAPAIPSSGMQLFHSKQHIGWQR